MKTQTTQSPQAGSAKSTAENIKDTLESVVVAFILAFVFRAFIVEAFVIPTGSMAVTPYGNQASNTCSTCGFEYARGIEQNHPPSDVLLKCPNCDTTPDKLYGPQVGNPDSGDRILVHKWPFDTGSRLLGPRRFEVTVFKDPADGTTNFIKRLIGLPGEVLEIIDGDVYTAPLEPTKNHPGLRKAASGLIERLEQLRVEVYEHGQSGQGTREEFERRRTEIERRYKEINTELLPHLRIRRKILESPRAQQALWFNVYNHDYLPNYAKLGGMEGPTPGSKRVGWHPDPNAAAKAAWNTSQREIKFDSNATEPLFIRFDGKPITDFSAYNSEYANHDLRDVGDVRVRFTWFPDAGSGDIVLQMNRDDATFLATIGADGHARIIHKQPGLTGGQQVIGERDKLFEPGQAVEIEFMNVDYLVCLVINGQTAIESKDQQYAPDVKRLLSPEKYRPEGYRVEPTQVRIGARSTQAGQPFQCRLRHVTLDRDVYYRDARQSEQARQIKEGVYKTNFYNDWRGWGTTNMPILLREDRSVGGKRYLGDYFMLGDNSDASKDSRLWWEIGPQLVPRGSEYQVGAVPGDQLIGEAFFVYWPAGYRPSWAGNIGFIPNVGRMRWIR